MQRLLAGLFVLLAVAAPLRADVRAEATLRPFYDWVLTPHPWSLPPPGEKAKLAEFLTPELMQLLAKAAETETRCVKAAPVGDKPLILEGDLFVGSNEGAHEVAFGKSWRNDNALFQEVRLIHIDSRFAKGHKHRVITWTNELRLRLAGERWLIEDIKFDKSASLASWLKGYIAEGKRACKG